MNLRRLCFCLAGMTLAMPVCAQQPGGDGLQWLHRVAVAAKQLNYSGVFVYQRGGQRETSRITHFLDKGVEFERLEVLDGARREVVRENDEVKCYLPESRLLIIERSPNRRTFPALLPGSLAGLSDYYLVRKGGTTRIAGFDSVVLIIEPKDDHRYGYHLWIDEQSGLLLKANLVDLKGNPLETFAFTELKIGMSLGRDVLRSSFEAKTDGWQVYSMRATNEVRSDEGQWKFRYALPGFRKQSSMKRQMRPDAPEGTHVIFSDGLAAVSVFFEPLIGEGVTDTAPTAIGAISIYKRQLGDTQLVVMGDIPAVALRRFADGIELRRR